VTRPKLNVVLPAHNEAENLARVVASLLAVEPEVNAELYVTIVNDGSADSTADIISELQQKHANVRSITHPANVGYGGAVISGLLSMECDFAAIMDADGQFDAKDLVRLFRQTDAFDVVVGYRSRRADPTGRKILGRLWTIAGRVLFRIARRDLNCGLKIFKNSIIRQLKLQCLGPGINMEIMSQIVTARIPIKEVACEHHARIAGKQSGASMSVVKRGLSELARIFMARLKRC
jgi:glycosyltransferase involved in cell wall biosynthesis